MNAGDDLNSGADSAAADVQTAGADSAAGRRRETVPAAYRQKPAETGAPFQPVRFNSAFPLFLFIKPLAHRAARVDQGKLLVFEACFLYKRRLQNVKYHRQ